jgi:hypothetical protein
MTISVSLFRETDGMRGRTALVCDPVAVNHDRAGRLRAAVGEELMTNGEPRAWQRGIR